MPGTQWNSLLSSEELTAHYRLTESLDPAFARAQREFYESRTVSQLEVLAHQAWLCCDADGYQMAQTYSALWTVKV